MKLTCARCGETFERTPNGRGRNRFCSPRCSARSKSPLTADKVREIIVSTGSTREIGQRFKVGHNTILRIKRALRWADVVQGDA
jgi:hypothetical protein